jgi:prevent-host-death family protein
MGRVLDRKGSRRARRRRDHAERDGNAASALDPARLSVVGPAHWSDRLCATVLHMQQVGVRELRHNLSAWLRRVRDGEAFEVTDRGTPVAVLAPLPSETDPVALLESRGQIARRGDGTRFSLPSLRSPLSTEEILAELREDKV